MSIQILLQTLINGLFLGGIYALFSVGLTLIYGVMYLINFAHGEFLMLGMYITYWIFVYFGLDPYVSIIFVIVLMFLFGLFLQRALFKPILEAPLLHQILLTLGASSLLMGLAQFFWGAEPRSINLPYSSNAIIIKNLIFNVPRTITLIVAIGLCIVLFLFLAKTKTGMAIRACSQSRPAAYLMGIDVVKINAITFGIGTAMVGLAGTLMTPSFPMSPTIGQNFGISGFVIVVLGTMGNTLGALIAALIIGVVEGFGGLIFGSQLRQVASMLVFVVILLFRPEGLFGRKRV